MEPPRLSYSKLETFRKPLSGGFHKGVSGHGFQPTAIDSLICIHLLLVLINVLLFILTKGLIDQQLLFLSIPGNQ